MKKTVIIIFSLLLLGFGLNAQSYESPYTAFEFGYESMAPYLEGFNGRLYYWVHPAQGLYFVAVGHRIFIIPHYQVYRLRGFIKFRLLQMSDFIHYTSMGMSYYENYLRFQFYKNYFYKNKYRRAKFKLIAKRFIKYTRKQIAVRYKKYRRQGTSNRNKAYSNSNRGYNRRRAGINK